ncbi:MAG: flagellar biosynthetic protein FliO [Thiomicrorhabdus sp.]|nr:flagellar biosynthetic protein FliO [Thiomicrorhabdus sp.]
MYKPYFTFALLGFLFTSLFYTSVSFAETAAIGESVTRPSEYFGQIMLSLVLVLLIIFLAAWVLRRYSRFPGVADGNLKVIGALSVGQRERILLLQVGQAQILVGVTSSKITTLHELEELVQVKDNLPLSSQFSKRLQDALKPKKKAVPPNETSNRESLNRKASNKEASKAHRENS